MINGFQLIMIAVVFLVLIIGFLVTLKERKLLKIERDRFASALVKVDGYYMPAPDTKLVDDAIKNLDQRLLDYRTSLDKIDNVRSELDYCIRLTNSMMIVAHRIPVKKKLLESRQNLIDAWNELYGYSDYDDDFYISAVTARSYSTLGVFKFEDIKLVKGCRRDND